MFELNFIALNSVY